jgi:hypothetical protein
VSAPSGSDMHEDYAELGELGLRFSAGELDAGSECEHGRLPGDRSPACGCWNEAQVTELPRRCWNCGGNGVRCCEYGCAA